MSYIRNPVYMWRNNDGISVSLPRGNNRKDPDGFFNASEEEMLAISVAFLARDFPEFVTEAGVQKLKEIRSQANDKTEQEIDRQKEKIDEVLALGEDYIRGTIMLSHLYDDVDCLNPNQYEEQMQERLDNARREVTSIEKSISDRTT
jgi:hypothetical protein